ncbi:hypothetical protein ACFWD7_23610 [Streptomyces mirabilis]|uniref:hypothetical protein n=1 Tax=Streptomyces mirabilis TaxID=68239 RepID=UPI0036801743
MIGEVTLVVDEWDNVQFTRAAQQAHLPAEGRITVQPTPASGSPAALAHDVLYALGKRLAPGPDTPDVWLDSVNPAWLAAAAWSAATGVRHVLVTRTHLLTTRRVDQLLAWRELTGVQLTLLWQTAPRLLPPVLARVRRRVSGRDQLQAVLTAAGPIPARPFFLPFPAGAPIAAVAARRMPPQWRARSAQTVPRQAHTCTGASAAAQLLPTVPGIEVAPEDTAALTAIAHPLIAGALGVLAFTGGNLGGLRWTRDLDITGDVSAIKFHGVGHRYCSLYAVPAWARPLLAGARAHHRLATHPPGDGVFAPVMLAEARHLRAHAGRLPRLDLSLPAGVLVP